MPCKSPEAFARKREKEKLSRRAKPEKIAAMNKGYRENRTPEQVEAKNQKMKEWRKTNQDHANTYAKDKIKNLSPAYIALKIGLPLAKIPPDLLAAKREQILLRREIKKLDEALK
jgi:phage host-nuclease inhibitor protein Gam